MLHNQQLSNMSIQQAFAERVIETFTIDIGYSLASFFTHNPQIELEFQHGKLILITNKHTWILVSSTLSLREALISLNNSSPT